MRFLMFETKLKKYIELIEHGLVHFLPKENKFCANFANSINYSTLNGGKRLRPVLTLATFELLSENLNLDAAVPFACAVEFIHSGSLIHDDLPSMDNSNFRRNMPSCHSKFGETLAVLAGDGLFLTAFKILTKANEFNIKNNQIVKACSYLSEMAGIEGMVLGQAIDMFAPQNLYNKNGNDAKQALETLAKLKTASLIRAACALGCFAAGANEQTTKKIDSYAKHLGLAFQICDDILDYENENESEAEQEKNKLTYVNLFGLNQSIEQAKIQTEIAINAIKNFEKSQFLINLAELMLKRIK